MSRDETGPRPGQIRKSNVLFGRPGEDVEALIKRFRNSSRGYFARDEEPETLVLTLGAGTLTNQQRVKDLYDDTQEIADYARGGHRAEMQKLRAERDWDEVVRQERERMEIEGDE